MIAEFKAEADATGVAVRQAATVVRDEDVYFAFPAGVWSFDCRECGAQCCRGHGYTVSPGRETELHVQGVEPLKLFMSPPAKGGFVVRNFKPGCYKLTDGGLCEVQVTDGYDAKPELCRL